MTKSLFHMLEQNKPSSGLSQNRICLLSLGLHSLKISLKIRLNFLSDTF